MDIWGWVWESVEDLRENGHNRLADLIEELGTNNEGVESTQGIVPEALALARQIPHPWLEVFIRHWDLQSRIATRMEGQPALRDAAALLEFAHREDTKDCPQTVCAVQDLSLCYKRIDGPGYADERMSVARETLERINPKWPCFDCLSTEWSEALQDKGDFEGSLAFAEEQIRKMRAAGIRTAGDYNSLAESKIEALIITGRLQDALKLADSLKKEGRPDAKSLRTVRMLRCRILVLLHRIPEALKEYPPFEEIMEIPSQFEDWVEATWLLVEANAVENDWKLGKRLTYLQDQLRKQGATWIAFLIGQKMVQLAVRREAFASARRLVSVLRNVSQELRDPERVTAYFRDVSAEIGKGGSKQILLPANPDEVAGMLSDNPEADLALLEAASSKWPSHETIAIHYSMALESAGFELESEQVLQQLWKQNPESYMAASVLAAKLGNSSSRKRLEDFCAELIQSNPNKRIQALGHYTLAAAMQEEGDWEKSNKVLEEAMQLDPEDPDLQLLSAKNHVYLGQWQDVLRRVEEAERLSADPEEFEWERIIAATALEKWDIARKSAAKVGFKGLEGEGEIEFSEGPVVRIQFSGEKGEPSWFALRTGPVTARILSIAPPPNAQHYSDLVLFDPFPLNADPAPDEEEGHTYLYTMLKVLKPGDYTIYDIDGVHPGPSTMEKLEEELTNMGAELQVFSGEDYGVWDSQKKKRVPGIFGMIAVPGEVPPKSIVEALSSSRKFSKLTYPGLLAAAGDADLAEQHSILRASFEADQE